MKTTYDFVGLRKNTEIYRLSFTRLLAGISLALLVSVPASAQYGGGMGGSTGGEAQGVELWEPAPLLATAMGKPLESESERQLRRWVLCTWFGTTEDR